MRSSKPIVLLFLAAFLPLLFGPGLTGQAGADEAKITVKDFEEKMEGADEQKRVELIQALAASGESGAAKAIFEWVKDRNAAVSCAAIRGLGASGDRKYAARLPAMIKMFEDDSLRMQATLDAIGSVGDRKLREPVMDVAKKTLRTDSEVASAAARALGKMPDKQAVEDLIDLLGLTFPRAASGGAQISDQTREILAKSRPAIMAGLQELTGWDFTDQKAWTNFWEKRQRTWKPGEHTEIEWSKLNEWEDPGYGFKVKRPGKNWEFRKIEGARIALVQEEEPEEGVETRMLNAQFWVQAYDQSNFQALTTQQKVEQKLDYYRQNWRDLKDETMVRDDRFRLGNERNAAMISFTGQDSRGNIMKMTNVILDRNGIMWEIGAWRRSGTPDEMGKEIDEIISSFQFTN